MPDWDRFSDEYDPEPDWDRPTRAEAEADERDDWGPPPPPRCEAGKLIAFHPLRADRVGGRLALGQPCRCGKTRDEFRKDFPEIA